MARHGVTAHIAFCLLSVIAFSRPTYAAECADRYYTDSAGTAEACTARLRERNLSNDERSVILETRGRALYDIGRLDAAALDFDPAIALSSDPGEIRVSRGYVALDQGDFPAAIKDAVMAQAEKPDSARPYALIGRIKYRMFDFSRATEAYRKAISIKPNFGAYHYELFLVLESWAHDREALEEADSISRLPDSELDAPNTINWWGRRTSLRPAIGIERGKLFKLMGRFDDAEKAYDDAVRTTPSAPAYAARADFHRAREAAADIIQSDVEKALALDPGFWFGHAVQAELDNDQKNTDSALSEYAKAAQLYPRLGWIHWQRALVLRGVGRIDEATAEALTAIEIDPDLFRSKSKELSKRGYLREVAAGTDPIPAFHDAIQACMLDERCP
jgi:tetratricopeptide (TPR) repeat protein